MTSGPALLAFVSPSKTRSKSRGPVALLVRVKACLAARPGPIWPGLGLLSWGCQKSPLHRHQCMASTPGRRPRSSGRLRKAARWCGPGFGAGPEGRCASRDATVAFGPEMPSSGLVPSLPFFPTSTVCSAKHLAGLLHPAADHGVRHVSGPSSLPLSGLSAVEHQSRSCAPCGAHYRRAATPPSQRLLRAAVWQARWRWLRGAGSFPGGAKPFGAFPSPAAVPCHHGRCPLAVKRVAGRILGFLPRRRDSLVRPVSRPRPQGFAPLASPLRPSGVSTAQTPDAPLGFPMRGFRSATANRFADASPRRGAAVSARGWGRPPARRPKSASLR